MNLSQKPSLRGFLKYLRLRFQAIFKGESIDDKLRLVLWSVLDSIPNIVKKKLPFVARIDVFKHLLLKKVMIVWCGCRFKCIDSESLLVLSPSYEQDVLKNIRLNHKCVFLDVGAHIGRYTILVAKRAKDGLVIAVEPNPENYRILRKNVELNELNNVVALNVAAWNKDCELKMYVGTTGSSHSLIKNYGLGSFIVKARVLDDILLYELKVKKLNCVKIDVEGAELKVLEGLRRTLRHHRPVLIIESWNLEALKNLLNELGYTITFEGARGMLICKPKCAS